MQEWCTIESDPAVFTELINNIGVKGVQVEEIYDLNDQQLLLQLQPIYGLIFLFRWTSKAEKRECLKLYDQDLFFANQVIQNACATQAIISVLLNAPQIDIGDHLTTYKDFALNLDSKNKGVCLGNLDVIRIAHNSFSRPEPFVFTQKKKAKEGDDVFHFISYIPFKGHVYELDGLQEGPIMLGSFKDDWLLVAREAIMKRVSLYQEKEVAFTLLAVNQCKRTKLNTKIINIERQIGTVLKTLQSQGVELSEFQLKQLQKVVEVDPLLEENQEQLNLRLNNLLEQLSDCELGLQEENQKFNHYKEENARRRHNYIPFILELFKIAQKKGKLETLIEKAKQKQQQKQQQQQQQK